MIVNEIVSRKQLIRRHNFINDSIFRLKILGLTGSRFFKNILSPTPKFTDKGELRHEAVLSFSESDLWNADDNSDNWILTAGKIENLRIAARKLNGIEVKANQIFSFWRHIGNPNFAQGYVIGREIREGCVVPTIAGGLCQLSNALYDAALKADFDIIERYKHTEVIRGSLAELDRDATVKWNYIDLRFKNSFDFRIEAELSADKLIVTFRSKVKNNPSAVHDHTLRKSNQLNDCYSCGNYTCFRHPGTGSVKRETAKTTFILDEKWVEFDEYVKTIAKDSDRFIVPLRSGTLLKTDRYNWTAMKPGQIKATTIPGIYRAIQLRYQTGNKNNVFELSLQQDRKIAHAAARLVSVDSTHLVISQNLLPFLYETGVLGGRTYDVLMTRLPVEKLHERLDLAQTVHPESKTLSDFRASVQIIALENNALTRSRKVITPHSEIAGTFINKVEKLNWHFPATVEKKERGSKVLFPAPVAGRKGAYEMKRLAIELKLNLVIAGRTIEADDFWKDLKVERFNGDFEQIGLVVYPTYIEHQPRLILKAISRGIPVISTTACGLESSDQVKIIGINNFDGLKNEVIRHLETLNSQENLING